MEGIISFSHSLLFYFTKREFLLQVIISSSFNLSLNYMVRENYFTSGTINFEHTRQNGRPNMLSICTKMKTSYV